MRITQEYVAIFLKSKISCFNICRINKISRAHYSENNSENEHSDRENSEHENSEHGNSEHENSEHENSENQNSDQNSGNSEQSDHSSHHSDHSDHQQTLEVEIKSENESDDSETVEITIKTGKKTKRGKDKKPWEANPDLFNVRRSSRAVKTTYRDSDEES